MTHRDDNADYLWDRSGEIDPTVARLEQVLGRMAHDGRELELPAPASTTGSGRVLRGWPWLVGVAAAAGVTVSLVLLWPEAELQPGSPARTFVAKKDPVVVALGELAAITLRPDSELRFEHWRADEALFRLERGAMIARVAPPPAVAPDFFLVDTELGRVTDKGCAFELRIESDGTNAVEVTEGAVTFDFADRVVYVPAGAGTRVDADGPSTPVFDDCSLELRRAVRRFDSMTKKGAVAERLEGVAAIVEASQEPRDSLVLWHLLRDDDEAVREQAEQALIDLVGPPEEIMTKGEQTWDPEVWLAFLRIGPWMQAK